MIRLSRSIEARVFDVQGTIAVGRAMPEFLAVARLAHSFGRINGSDVDRELLGGRGAHVGELVIDRCEALGLLDRDSSKKAASLSRVGEEALGYGQVLVPEEGIWRILWAEDPLLNTPLLLAYRLPDKAKLRDDVKALRSGQPDAERSDPTPAPIRESAGAEVLCLSVASGRPFQIKTLSDKGRVGSPIQLELSLTWPAEEPAATLRLSGDLGALISEEERSVDRELPKSRTLDSLTYETAWIELVTGASEASTRELAEWRRRAGSLRLPVAFEDLTPRERRDMERVLQLQRPALPRAGYFGTAEDLRVTLVPKTDAEARAWARWSQRDAIVDYTTSALVEESSTSIRERFPFHEVSLATPQELLAEAIADPLREDARFLLAPHDLGLWRTES